MALVWITGAHGFIGKHLARALADAGQTVCGIGHGLWPQIDAERWGIAHWLNGDIHAGNLRQLQRSTGTPDVIYHLAGGSSVGAAIANPREDFYRTVATTAELLDWLRQDVPGARLVAVSSAAVYGAGWSGPIAETAPRTPYSPYGHHKAMMEQLCASHAATYGLKVVTARLFSVFGPELKKQLLWDLCSRLASGTHELALGGSGDEARDWTDVRDTVRALVLLASQADVAAPVVNVGTGLSISVRRIAAHVARCWAGSEGTAVPLKFSGESRPGDPFSLVADPSRLNALGFAWHVPVERGLADYVQWFREQQRATR